MKIQKWHARRKLNIANRVGVVVLAAVLAAACRSPTTPTPPRDETAFTMTSDQDHVVGMGESFSYTRQNTQFESRVEPGGGELVVNVLVSQGPIRQWILILGAPTGRTLAPGTFTFAREAGPGVHGLDLFASPGSRRCMASGQITIQEIAYTATSLQRFRATFEHRCDNEPPTLRGVLVVLNDR